MANPPAPPKTEEQLHYESMISYAKWALGFSGSVIAAIIAFGLYFTYQDRNAMKEEYTKAITDLRGQLAELKNDAEKKTDGIKNDAKDAVKSTQEYSEKEISRIKTTTNDIALQETQKNIAAIFATDKIQNLIQNQAVKEIKSKLPAIVDERTKNISKIDAAAATMISGHIEGLKLLQSYFLNPESSEDSLRAKKLYDDICMDYENRTPKMFGGSRPVNLPISDSIELRNSLRNGELPTTRLSRDAVVSIIANIKDPENKHDLNMKAYFIYALNYATGTHFKCFEFDKINDWFNGLRK